MRPIWFFGWPHGRFGRWRYLKSDRPLDTRGGLLGPGGLARCSAAGCLRWAYKNQLALFLSHLHAGRYIVHGGASFQFPNQISPNLNLLVVDFAKLTSSVLVLLFSCHRQS